MSKADPNTCRVPNAFFDEILPTASDAELRVLLHIIRQTYGWNRQWTTGGFGRVRSIAAGAGLTPTGAMNAIKTLRERGVIEARAAGKAMEYRLSVQRGGTTSCNVVEQPSAVIVQRGGTTSFNMVVHEPCNDVALIKRQSSKDNYKLDQEDIAADAAPSSPMTSTPSAVAVNVIPAAPPTTSAEPATPKPRKPRPAAPPRPREPRPLFDAFCRAWRLQADGGKSAGLAGGFDSRCRTEGATVEEFEAWVLEQRRSGDWGKYTRIHSTTDLFLAARDVAAARAPRPGTQPAVPTWTPASPERMAAARARVAADAEAYRAKWGIVEVAP